MDEFDMEIHDVGELQKLRVGLSGDAAWSLESVTVCRASAHTIACTHAHACTRMHTHAHACT